MLFKIFTEVRRKHRNRARISTKSIPKAPNRNQGPKNIIMKQKKKICIRV